jgi:naphthoate synthase
MSAAYAKEIGLINRVVPDDQLGEKTREFALEVADRGAFALASIKGAFGARHGGVSGLSRVTHDLLLSQYLGTAESKELNASFNERRKPDHAKFGK